MNVVEVQGLTKRFGDLQALAGVDLALAPGEVGVAFRVRTGTGAGRPASRITRWRSLFGDEPARRSSVVAEVGRTVRVDALSR